MEGFIRCFSGSADQLFSFYQDINPKNFLPFDRSFFESCLVSKDAACFSAYNEDGTLLGYGIVILMPCSHPVLLPVVQPIVDLLGVFLEPEYCAYLCGTIIDPVWRGKGLHHSFLAKRIAFSRVHQKHFLLVTVSPMNSVSLKNLLRMGFVFLHVVKVHEIHVRFVLVKFLNPGLPNSGSNV